ncbi:MAG TPA: response regulator [Candidatus Methylacidiphilales bacterium]|nr:response regulator [Candidatus Methylacidiphilales bacterium]
MTVLLADDDATNRDLMRAIVSKKNYDLVEASNGAEALQILEKTSTPLVALLDWEMPEMEGVEVCRRVRANKLLAPRFLILVTVRDSKRDIVAGLSAGANDYITKPFDKTELLARVNTGAQMVELQQALTQRVEELADALAKVKQLTGLLPICSYCKKIRDDKNYWQQVDDYVSSHSEATFSHSICPVCYEQIVLPQLRSSESDPK